MYAPESVELLQKSGIDLQRHEDMGIEPNDFAELMITSGLVLSEDVKWISFHRYALYPIILAAFLSVALPTISLEVDAEHRGVRSPTGMSIAYAYPSML